MEGEEAQSEGSSPSIPDLTDASDTDELEAPTTSQEEADLREFARYLRTQADDRTSKAEADEAFYDAWSDWADEEESDVESFFESSDLAEGLALQHAAEQSSSSDSEENLSEHPLSGDSWDLDQRTETTAEGRSTRNVRVLSTRA